MLFNVRGVMISRRGPDKYVTVVAQVGYTDIYKVIEKKANVPITRDLILNYAASHYGIPKESIVWPHHVNIIDI